MSDVPNQRTMWREGGRMWDKIGEYTLASPPVPKDKSVFLNPITKGQYAQKFEHTPDLPTAAEYARWAPHRQQELADREWDRRTNGVWFWNNGEPTFIPGPYYYFLNYHRFKDKKPQYRNSHRQLYWVWCLFVLVHRNCLGIFLHTRRRWGKTACAASIGDDAVSGTANFHFGIQSKDEEGARKLYLREVQVQLTRIIAECPWFYQHTATSNKPQREFIFDKPSSKKQGASADTDNLGGLNSRVDWLAATGAGYDSEALDYFINDEVGKKQRENPWARHSVVSKQFYPNGYVVGKEFAMTTSDEDDDDSVEMAKTFWDESDPALLEQRKGLARLFFPDTQGFIVDEYGYDTPESLADLNAERVAAELAGPAAWIRRRRAFPRSIEEAHLASVKSDCVFNQQHIGDCQTAVSEYNAVHVTPLVQRYRLYWEDAARTRVACTQDDNGRFYLSWLPPAEWLNQVQQVGTITTKFGVVPRMKPLNAHRFFGGVDPFDSRETLQEGSKGGMVAYYGWDTQMENRRGEGGYWPSHSRIGEYAERPADPDMFYEDGVMWMHWLGCKFFVETQKPNFETHARARGYGDFLAKQPTVTMSDHVKQFGSERTGAASSVRLIGEYTNAKIIYYQKYVGGPTSTDSVGNPHGMGKNDDGVPYDFRRSPFTRLMTQDTAFEPMNPAVRKKSDLSVADGFALLHMTGIVIQPRTENKKGLTLKAVRGLMGMYR